MTGRWASAVGLAAGVLLVVVALGCAARQQASDVSYYEYEEAPGEVYSEAETPERMLREQDMMRLETYQELQREMDEGIASAEGDMAEDPYYQDVEPPGFGEKTGNFFQTAGLVTWAVFTVAFSLGMAALPFLI
jgi:hypothetical protein